MKKYIILIILFISFGAHHCTAQSSWVRTNNVSPTYSFFTPNYSFSTPDTAGMFDTLNVKLYYYNTSDSSIAFHVLEHQNAKFDSTQTDTLGFIVSSLLASTNAVLLNSQAIPLTDGYKGVEINVRYNDLDNGQILVSYYRLYFQQDLMLTFSVTGYENNLTQLVADKILFFNSIAFVQN
jgi:hypothetical protein